MIILFSYILVGFCALLIAAFIQFCIFSVIQKSFKEVWEVVEDTWGTTLIILLVGSIFMGAVFTYKHYKNEKCKVDYELVEDTLKIKVSGSKVKDVILIHEGNK